MPDLENLNEPTPTDTKIEEKEKEKSDFDSTFSGGDIPDGAAFPSKAEIEKSEEAARELSESDSESEKVIQAKPESEGSETELAVESPPKVEKSEPAPEVSDSLTSDEDPGLLAKLLTDEGEFKNDIVREVKTKIENELRASEAQKAQVENFYKENPDLVSHKRFVSLVRDSVDGMKDPEGKELSTEAKLSLLASETRTLIQSLRSNYEEVDTESASDTAVVSSSGTSAPHVVKKPVRKSFADSLINMQKKKGIA